eukprot:s507_g5.t1
MALSPKHATSLLRQCGEESPAARGERRLRSLRSQRIEIDVLHCNALLSGWSRQSHWEEVMLLLMPNAREDEERDGSVGD